MLKFSPANAKTESLYSVDGVRHFLREGRKVYSLDLSAGYSCPGALDCLSRAVEREDSPGRFTILDGPNCRFRCFSASQEVQYTATRKLRRHNFDCLRKARGVKACRNLLADSLPADIGVLRFHVSGDFFKLAYLQGALALANERPDVLFYAYTKSLRFIERYEPMWNPGLGIFNPQGNFLITASRGGKYDYAIRDLGLREAVVVFSEAEAERHNLPIDHDDSHAATVGRSFALLLHGTQPKGSEAATALSQLKGKGSYARSSK